MPQSKDNKNKTKQKWQNSSQIN